MTVLFVGLVIGAIIGFVVATALYEKLQQYYWDTVSRDELNHLERFFHEERCDSMDK